MRLNKRHRQPLQVMSDINVTNLLDTAFILLITFMLVAPQLSHGLKISPPEVEDAPQMEQSPDRTFFIGIQPAGEEGESERVYVKTRAEAESQRVTVSELYDMVSVEHAARPKMNVVIEPDEAASSGILVQVIGAVKRAGVKDMGISVLPKTEP
ncbi:MAG: ExbD/TolR family protein [Candidatus Sumerlaeota bacterium]